MNEAIKTSPPAGRIPHRRHRHYVDRLLQGRLLLGLLLMESLLFGGAMIWLYLALDSAIESNMYRVHFSESAGFSDLQTIYLYILPTLLVINFMAIWLADRIWEGHVNHIIEALRSRLQKIARRDLRDSRDDHEYHHEVLDKASQWRQYEQDRYLKLNAVIRDLADELAATDTALASAKLEEIRRLMQ